MTEFHTIKRIDNTRLVRTAAASRWRECCRLAALGGMLAGGLLLYTWQHFQCLELRYEMEELKSERAQAAELNLQLQLETASLRSPMRIDAIARRELGLTAPVPGQVAPAVEPAEPVLAQARIAAQQPR